MNTVQSQYRRDAVRQEQQRGFAPRNDYGFASRKSFTIGTMMGMRCINVT